MFLNSTKFLVAPLRKHFMLWIHFEKSGSLNLVSLSLSHSVYGGMITVDAWTIQPRVLLLLPWQLVGGG